VPRRFAAYGLLILSVAAGMIYLVAQFRFEIGSFFRMLGARLFGVFSRRKRSRPSYN
jgi:hypothetical protein